MCLAQIPQCSDASEAQTRGTSVSNNSILLAPISTKCCLLCRPFKMYVANSVDANQTAPRGAV